MKLIFSFLLTGAFLFASPSNDMKLGHSEPQHQNDFHGPVETSHNSPANTHDSKFDLPKFSSNDGPKVELCPRDPGTPSTATPEPASYALLGAGLVVAGVARRFGVKK